MIKFNYLSVKSTDKTAKKFYLENRDDIEIYFPDFDVDEVYLSDVELLVVDEKLCGLLVYQAKGDQMHIELDYVTAECRNKGIGENYIPKLFDKFRKSGYKMVYAGTGVEKHKKYLRTLGFKNSKSHSDLLEQALN